MPSRSLRRRSDFCRAPHDCCFPASARQCIRPKTVTAFTSLNALGVARVTSTPQILLSSWAATVASRTLGTSAHRAPKLFCFGLLLALVAHRLVAALAGLDACCQRRLEPPPACRTQPL